MQERGPWEDRSRRKVSARGASHAQPGSLSRAQGGEVPSRVTEKEGGTQQPLEIHTFKEGEDAMSTEGRSGKVKQRPHWAGSTADELLWRTQQHRLKTIETTGNSNSNSRNYRKRNAAARPQSSEQSLRLAGRYQTAQTHTRVTGGGQGQTETSLKKRRLKRFQV